MRETKTIEIDEIVSPDDTSSKEATRSRSAGADQSAAPKPDDLFAELKKSLGWKTRATLWLTQKFLYLKSKSWGIWVIVPLAILALLLALPLGILLAVFLFFRSTIKALRGQN